MLYFWVSVIILAVLLFFPVSKLIWVFSVRRLQRKLQRELGEEEIQGQLNRARFVTVLIVVPFSFLFCFNIIGYPGGG